MRGPLATLALMLGLAGLCAGCGTSGRLDPSAAVRSPDDSYFVIAVHGRSENAFGPAGQSFVAVSDAIVKNGKAEFEVSLSNGLVPFLDYTENDYVVGKAHRGGDTLAIWGINRYSPCGATNIVVFTAPAGKVVYITDIDTTGSRGGWQGDHYMQVRYRKDIEAARAFLRSHYPNLADKLEPGSYELVPCEGGYPFP